MTQDRPDSDARARARRAHMALHDTMTQLKSDAATVTEPLAKALFETSAEVLRGMMKAFEDYERAEEPAWRR